MDSPTWRWPTGAPMRPPMVNSHRSNWVWASAGTGTIINMRLIERVHARALVMLASRASEERGGHARTDGPTRRGAGLFRRRSAERLRGDRRRARAGGAPERRAGEDEARGLGAIDPDEAGRRVEDRLRDGRERAGDEGDDGVEVVVVPEAADPRRVGRVRVGRGDEAHEEHHEEHGPEAPCGHHGSWWAQAGPRSSRVSSCEMSSQR